MYSRDSPDPHPTKSTDTDSRYYQQKPTKEVSLETKTKQLTILRMVLLKVSSRSNPCSNGSDPSDLLDEGEEKARLLAEEGFKVSILKSEPFVREAVEGFPSGRRLKRRKISYSADPDPSWIIYESKGINNLALRKKDTVLRFVGSKSCVKRERKKKESFFTAIF